MAQNGYRSDESELRAFLQSVASTLCDKSFRPSCDIDIVELKDGEDPEDECTTYSTLQRLDFFNDDICEVLLELKPQDYLETCPDIKFPKMPCFFAFVKAIKGEDIYIKFRINSKGVKVFCISFHRARFSVNYNNLPYRHSV